MLTMHTFMVTSYPRKDPQPYSLRETDLFYDTTPLDTFWLTYRILATVNEGPGYIEHLGEGWMDKVLVVGWTLHWDPRAVHWCGKIPPSKHDENDEDYFEDHRWCGASGNDRFRWFEERLYEDDFDEEYIESRPYMFASELVPEEDGVEELPWAFGGTFRALALQIARTDRLPRVIVAN